MIPMVRQKLFLFHVRFMAIQVHTVRCNSLLRHGHVTLLINDVHLHRLRCRFIHLVQFLIIDGETEL